MVEISWVDSNPHKGLVLIILSFLLTEEPFIDHNEQVCKNQSKWLFQRICVLICVASLFPSSVLSLTGKLILSQKLSKSC